MRIVNVTRSSVIADHAEVTKSAWQRLRGLLGRKELAQGHGLLLNSTNSIHTFFMAFPIDAVFLDKHLSVVKVMEHVGPNRVSPIVLAARSVLELPAGTAGRNGVQAGDRLALEET